MVLGKNYLLPISETISTAWYKVYGAKKTIWFAIGIFTLIVIGLSLLEGISKAILPVLGTIINIITQVIIFLLQVGLLYIGILRARDSSIHYKQIYRAFEAKMALKVIVLYVLKTLVLLPAILIAVIPTILTQHTQPSDGVKLITVACYLVSFIIGVYLYVRMVLSMGLVLDKETNPWDAIKMSFRATRENFWRLFFISLIQLLIVVISIIPLGLGLIWSIPFALILYGVVYNRLLVNL